MHRCAHCSTPYHRRHELHEHCSSRCYQRAWHAEYKANHGISYHTQYARDRKAQESTA